MTARRIYATARPSLITAPVIPMNEHDRRFPHSRVRPVSMAEWRKRHHTGAGA